MRGRFILGAVLFLLAAQFAPGARSAFAAGPGEIPGAPATAAEFASGKFQLKLPKGLEPLAGAALTGYEAAVLSDFPGAARTILAAANPDRSAALLAAEIDSDADCLDAARDAADALLRYPDAARELRFGANRCAGFGCAVGAQAYHLYFLSDGRRVLLVATCGLEAEAVGEMLAGLRM